MYEHNFGTTILVLSWIVIFSLLIYLTGYRLSQLSRSEKKVSEDLQRTQSVLVEAESLSHTGAWEWDIGKGVWTFSDEWLKIHGSAHRSLRPEELMNIAHPDDRVALERALEALRRGERPYQIEHRIVRQNDGEVRVVKAHGQFVKDRLGRVVRVYGFVQDVTEQKAAEREVELQRQLLEAVVQHLPAGILIVRGRDLKILMANPAYRQLAPGREMLNKTLEEVWPEVYAELEESYRHVLETGAPFHILDRPYHIARSPDGPLEKRYFTWSLFPVQLPGGHGPGLLNACWETTDRMKSEEALRDSEQRLRSVIHHLAEGLIVIDPERRTLQWNPKALAMYHYTGEEAHLASLEALGGDYELLALNGEVLSFEQWPINKVLRGEEFEDYDIVVRNRKQNWEYVHSFDGVVIRGADGVPVMGLLTLKDLTARTRAEQALRESEELLNNVLETLPVAVWILGADGRVLRANKAAHEIWAGFRQVTMEQFGEYKGWWLDSGRRVAPEEWGGARAILKGETSLEEEVEIECFDGSRKIILNSSVPIRNEKGGITGAISISQDITARKRAEDAVRASEGKFRAVFQQAAVGMGTVSFTEARWIEVNEAFCTMLGYSRQEMLETPWPQMTHPEDLDLDLIPFRQMGEGRLESYSVEKRFIHKSGKHIWARLTLSLVRDAMGNPDYEIAIIEDITDRKRAEEALRKAKDELEQRVQERTRELEGAYADLKRETEERVAAVEDLRKNEQLLIQQSRLAAMGEMLGNIAHQWRQPLNNLGLLVQHLSLSQEMGELTVEHLEGEVAKAMHVIQHMSRTIDDFQNYLQEEKEKHVFEVNEAIVTTISLLEATLKAAEVNLEIRHRDKLFVNGHRNEFLQVVMNIITNARDAFRERNTGKARLIIDIFKDNGRPVITIADNAGGIPEAVIGKIFDPYFTTKGPDKGTGIGLFMSKNIIEKSMRGTLSVRNTGEGAEFRIEL